VSKSSNLAAWFATAVVVAAVVYLGADYIGTRVTALFNALTTAVAQ
jgi:hypothetical protein